MSNDTLTKDPKVKPEGVKRPQRKDSFSTVLQWTGLQGKFPIKPPVPASPSPAPTNTSTSPQSLPSLTFSKPRRHSHSFDIKKKARPESISRKFSFSSLLKMQDGTGAKTKNQKPSVVTQEAKSQEATATTSKSGKNGSAEKINKNGSAEKVNKKDMAAAANTLTRPK